MPSPLDPLLATLVRQLCPSGAPGQIDYLILHLYLSSVLIAALLLSFAALFRRLFAPPPPPPPQWPDEQLAVHVFLDCNPSPATHLPLLALLDALRDAILASWPLAGPDRPPRILFSCYLDRADPRRAPLVAQLEALEHSSDGSVRLIHSAPSRPPSSQIQATKPLLHDLLKLDTLSSGRRLYVVSTADEALCAHGLALLKTLPCSPLLCYVPPFGLERPPPEPAAADLVFRWAAGTALVSEERVGLAEGPCPPDLAEFHPLALLLRAHGAPLPLPTLADALAPWFFDPDRPADSPAQELDAYIQAAVAKGVVVLSCKPLGAEGSFEDTTMVSLGKEAPAQESAPLSAKQLTPDPAERSGGDEDRLTTTGSDSEDVSSKQSDSPTLRGKLAATLNEARLAPTREPAVDTEQQHQQGRPEGKPQKHKQTASETGPFGERPVKKKKNQPGALRAPFRVVAKTRRRSLRKAGPAHAFIEEALLPAVVLSRTLGPQEENESRGESGAAEAATSSARSRPRSIELGTAGAPPPGSLPAHLHNLPCSPGLWMHTTSGLVDSARAPLSLGLGSLYRNHRSYHEKGSWSTEEPVSSAHERFARMFSPKIVCGTRQNGYSKSKNGCVVEGKIGYPFPEVIDDGKKVIGEEDEEEGMEVD